VLDRDSEMTDSTLIRSAKPSDADAITRIYNHYITETVVTFETEEVSAAEMARRIEQIQSASFPWLLADGDIHTVIGGIALPNDTSVALHEKFGFRKAAHYSEVGFKFGSWIDVGYWQRIL
jgi:L-amino acid N-acyltransferase YncA